MSLCHTEQVEVSIKQFVSWTKCLVLLVGLMFGHAMFQWINCNDCYMYGNMVWPTAMPKFAQVVQFVSFNNPKSKIQSTLYEVSMSNDCEGFQVVEKRMPSFCCNSRHLFRTFSHGHADLITMFESFYDSISISAVSLGHGVDPVSNGPWFTFGFTMVPANLWRWSTR